MNAAFFAIVGAQFFSSLLAKGNPLLAYGVVGLGASAYSPAKYGILAGLFVVPMNAILQHRGHRPMSAGQSIAVQNFNENLAILAMTSSYALALQAKLRLDTVLVSLGMLIVLVTMALRGMSLTRGD